MARVLAFYSYKGGVGRSLALANVAWALAARGKRVVVVDLDLEAPSLHTIAELATPSGPKKGVIEYAAAYAETGECPPVQAHLHSSPPLQGRGKLWLMPAGLTGTAYQDALARLDWARLHPTEGTRSFVERFRQAIVEATSPHYILVDSRTGMSEGGGLTTHLLADTSVLVFNLTRACLEGTVRAYRSMLASNPKLDVMLVAGQIPPGGLSGNTIVAERLARARELMPVGTRFGRDVFTIPYDPEMALSEHLAVTDPDRFAAARGYEALCRSIQATNPDDV